MAFLICQGFLWLFLGFFSRQQTFLTKIYSVSKFLGADYQQQVSKMSGLCKLRTQRFLYNKGSITSGFSALRAVCSPGSLLTSSQSFQSKFKSGALKSRYTVSALLFKNLTAAAAPEKHHSTPLKPHQSKAQVLLTFAL